MTETTSRAVEAHRPTGALAIGSQQDYWTDQQLATLRALGVEDASEGDLRVFFHQSVRSGLDPFARQIYLVGRNAKVRENGQERWGKKYTIQTGIDGYRLIARRAANTSRETLGYEDTLWCGPDGKWTDVWLKGGHPAAAKVTVLRGGERFPAIALWDEYVQTTSRGEPNSMWARMGAGQLAKCAEALALRRAYPQDLSGLYVDAEMGQADNVAGEVVGSTEAPAGEPRVQRVTAAHVAEQRQAEQRAVDPVEPFDADALRDAVFAAPSRASLRLALIGLGAIRVVDGRDSWDNARLNATRVADAQGQETDGLTLVRAVASRLPAQDPAPASAADDDVAMGEFMDEEGQA